MKLIKRLKSTLSIAFISVIYCSSLSAQEQISSKGTFVVTRLNAGQPIITEAMFQALGATDHEGEGMTGASAIKIPSWISPANRVDPSAVYYLYFGHHAGDYIRLAWASDIQGPWTLYDVGAGVSVGDRGVLDLGNSSLALGNGIVIPNNHIASPDVHIDDENQKIILYFHSGSTIQVDNDDINGQKSFVATSDYGLEFSGQIEPVILGDSYFAVFEYDGNHYALDNGGGISQARNSGNLWGPPSGWDFSDHLWLSGGSAYQDDLSDDGYTSAELRVRHTGVRVDGDTLYTFYTRRGVTGPERIMLSVTDLAASNDFSEWDPSYPPEEIYQAQPGWEGGQLEDLPSATATAPENVDQLRDPSVFEDDDGQLYVFYSGAGEDAIGLIHLEPRGLSPTDSGAPSPATMTWHSRPTALNSGSIAMTATTATDARNVKYYFENLADASHDSGWQISPHYIDSGLEENTSYSYRVQARDMSANQNTNNPSVSASAITSSPNVATIFENFTANPTNSYWTNDASGNTAFTYNSRGYLEAEIHRDSSNRSNYYTQLSSSLDKNDEFWMSMDVKLLESSSNITTSLFGVFGGNNNHTNFIGDRFSYKQTSGSSRGNRHDLYGYARDGSKLSFTSAYIEPGIEVDQSVRVKIHYFNDSGVGRGSIDLYEINDSDGSDGDFIMGAVQRTVISSSDNFSVDKFGLGNRTDGNDNGNNISAIDNLYFSISRENQHPKNPSWNANIFSYSDGFESCFTNWASDGFCSGRANTGSKSLKLDNDESATTSISTLGASSVTLAYVRNLSDMNGGDHFASEWFDGNTWHSIESISSGFTGWTEVTFNLPAAAGNNDDFQLRFRVDNGSKDFGYVDDLEMY